ncbi:hypothetical protein A2U01_0038031, partial [Trifolium medium]|nr:hypothetical protein [Trifolium medium]
MIVIPSSSDKSDAATDILEDESSDNQSELSTEVLHFPNHISRGVLAKASQIELMSEDTEFHYHCPIHSSDRSADKGYYEKHIADG